MAVSGRYGKVDVPQIGEDEPIFILRAQDMLAEPTMAVYGMFLSCLSSPLTENLKREIQAFRQWNGPKKGPD